MEQTSIKQAFALLESEDIPGAIVIATEALERGTKELEQAVRFADKLRARGRHGESLPFFDYVLSHEPANFDVLANKTRALYDMGERVPAAHAVDALAKLARGNRELQIKLFKTYTYLSSYHFAQELADGLIRENPNWFAIRQSLARMHLDRGRVAEARVVLDDAMRLDCLQSADWTFVAVSLLALKDSKSAQVAARKAVQLAPPPGIAEHFAHAQILMSLMKVDAAEYDLDSIKDHLNAVDDRLRAAELYLAMNRQVKAVAVADALYQALREQKIAVHIATRLALIFNAAGSPETGREILDRINIVDIPNLHLLKVFHKTCYDVKAYDLAERSARRALELLPHDEYYRQQLMMLKLLIGAQAAPVAPAQPAAPRGLRSRFSFGGLKRQ